jgi:hypothetical protein
MAAAPSAHLLLLGGCVLQNSCVDLNLPMSFALDLPAAYLLDLMRTTSAADCAVLLGILLSHVAVCQLVVLATLLRLPPVVHVYVGHVVLVQQEHSLGAPVGGDMADAASVAGSANPRLQLMPVPE